VQRVAILVENLPVPFDRRVWQEATTLRSAGFEVTVICPDSEGYPAGNFVIDGVHIRRFPLRFEARGLLGYVREYVAALFRMSIALARVRVAGRIDIIHVCNPPDLLFLLTLPFKLLDRTRVIFDQHDLGPELMVAKGSRRDGPMVRLAGLLEKATYRAADVVISTNESYRSIAMRRGGKSPGEVHTVRSGPSREWGQDAVGLRDHHCGKRYLVGYVGVMGRQEGLDYLLEAAEIIHHRQGRSDVHFALVGGGPELQHLKRSARERRLDGVVTFHGRVSDEELISILKSADLCVNPDEYNEMNDLSTMNKVVEYMALGKPIVQFDLTEGRFSAGEASSYVARNDSQALAHEILALLDDADRREVMGTFGLRRFRDELSWESQAPRLLAAYRHASDGGGEVVASRRGWVINP